MDLAGSTTPSNKVPPEYFEGLRGVFCDDSEGSAKQRGFRSLKSSFSSAVPTQIGDITFLTCLNLMMSPLVGNLSLNL